MMRNKDWYRNTYLKSPHWRNFSRTQLRKRLICEECLRNPATELHHRIYYRDGVSILGKERPTDMTAICRTCHDEIERQKVLDKQRKQGRIVKHSALSTINKMKRFMGI